MIKQIEKLDSKYVFTKMQFVKNNPININIIFELCNYVY